MPLGPSVDTIAAYLTSLNIHVMPGAKVFFVRNATSGLLEGAIGGSNGNSGNSPYEPLSTVFGTTGALTKCASGRGDVVVVMPGHSETITAVGTVSVSDVAIVGVKTGNKRPIFTVNGTVDLFSLTGNNITLQSVECNIVTTDAATAFVNVAGSGCTLRDLYCIPSSGTANVVDVITLAAGANDTLIQDCRIFNTVVAVNSFLSIEAAVARLQVRGCRFYGDTATGGLIDGAVVATFVELEDNVIATIGTTQPAALLDGNAAPLIAIRNHFLGTSATIADNAQLGNLARRSGNFVLEATDGSASATQVIPVADVE